jgi:hypothetical protein
MRFTHVEEIKKSTIGIIAIERNNSPTGIGVWVQALITAKTQSEREVKKQPRPWFAPLSRTGQLTKIETITPDMKTRRTRPKEK